MTTLVCDFIDIIGEPIDGVASLSTGEVRPDYYNRSVKVPHPVSETVVAGQATFNNVRPGKAVLTVHWEGRSATFRFTVPDAESISLIDATVGEGLEQSELDEFRAGIAAEFRNTREVVIEAATSAAADAATAQQAATSAADSATAAQQAAATAAADAVAEASDAISADAQRAETAAAEAEAAAGTAAADAAASVRSELDTRVSDAEAAADRAEQHEAGAAAAAAYEVNKLKGAAPEAFDTLEEIAAELAANETERSALANSIAAKADKNHSHTQSEVEGLEDALAGKADVGHKHTSADITDSTDWINHSNHPNKVVRTREDGFVHGNSPTLDRHVATKLYVDQEVAGATNDGYLTRHVDDPATDYPSGISVSMNNALNQGWRDKILEDSGIGSYGNFVVVTTIRNPTYSMSVHQIVKSYNDVDRPFVVRKWLGAAGWSPFRRLTDDGHTHTSADITDAYHYVGGSAWAGRVVKTHINGHIYVREDPPSPDAVPRKSYVDQQVNAVSARTPEIRVVSSPEQATSPGVLYVVREG